MMGERMAMQDSLFYEFRLEEHVPADHQLRLVDRFVDLSDLRRHLAGFYSPIGRPSVDPELMIRMLIVGYCYGIRSERRLCEEVHLNLAYRWFCRLGLEGQVPDHSTFSKNRHGRFSESDVFRHLFETVVERCIAEGLVDGKGFAVDASLIEADANRQRSIPGADWNKERNPETASRSVREYLETLDEAAWGAATNVEPKFVSPSDPAAQWTGAMRGPAFFAYADNYLVDVRSAIIVDVEASRAVRQAELGAARTMIARTADRFGLRPRATGRRYRLWIGANAELAGRGAQHRAPYPGDRQVGAPRWHLRARRLPIRPRCRYLHLPGRQGSDHQRHACERWRNIALPRQHAGLRSLSVQGPMLS
jgi:transposase